MKTSTKQTSTRPAMPDNSIPEWVNETPLEHSFELLAYCEFDGELQSVKVTRDEYIEMKRHLAVMRGYTAAEQAAPEHGRAGDTAREDDPAREIGSLDEYDGQLVAAALKVIQAGEFSLAPAEYFIRSLLDTYRCKAALTPDEARDELEVFTGHFKDMSKASREFLAKYKPAL